MSCNLNTEQEKQNTNNESNVGQLSFDNFAKMSMLKKYNLN